MIVILCCFVVAWAVVDRVFREALLSFLTVFGLLALGSWMVR